LRVGEFDERLIADDELASALEELLPTAHVLTWQGPQVATRASAGRSITLADIRWRPVGINLQPWLAGATG